MSYDAWGNQRIVWETHATTPAEAIRIDYLAFQTGHPGMRRETTRQQTQYLQSIGATITKETITGIRIVGPPTDSGYRVTIPGAGEPTDPTSAVVALAQLGIPARNLDIAWLHLAQQPSRSRGGCGQVTRHRKTHKGCQ